MGMMTMTSYGADGNAPSAMKRTCTGPVPAGTKPSTCHWVAVAGPPSGVGVNDTDSIHGASPEVAMTRPPSGLPLGVMSTVSTNVPPTFNALGSISVMTLAGLSGLVGAVTRADRAPVAVTV